MGDSVQEVAASPGLSELHRHLDGSLRRETLDELAAELGTAAPERLHFEPGMGLEAALGLFRVTLSVLQAPASVERVAREICEDAAGEGVSTLEIRFAPQLHLEGEMTAMEEVVDAALSGCSGRAGLILCGLYGESPELFDRFLELAAGRPGVVGIDLAGGPDSSHDFAMADYGPAFVKARDLGLGRTVHAGEGRPPSEIREAVLELHAQRIGHGTSLLEDETLVDVLLERGVTLEACLTSNVHTSAIERVEDHPLPRWLELGLKACINTDNTLFSRVDSISEYLVAATLPGMREEWLKVCAQHGHDGRFVR